MVTDVDSAGDALKPLLYQGYTDHWSASRWHRIERALRKSWRAERSANVYEADITAVLSALNEPLEAVFVRLLCDVAGITYNQQMRLFTTAEFLNDVDGKRGKHRPDFIIGHVVAGFIKPDVVVEVKGRAWVNGGVGYCPDAPEIYSNQALCYLHGCWTTYDLTGVEFCWIGLRSTVEDLASEFPWGRRGVNATDNPDCYGDAYDRQRVAAARWHRLALEDVSRALQPAGPGKIVADLIDAWVDQISTA